MSRAVDIVSALKILQNEIGELSIVETGTIRNTGSEYHEGDGHSTMYIAEYVKENGGNFQSIDLDISVCQAYMKEKNLDLYVNLIQGNSLDVLPELKFNVAYLDSANDEDLIFKEFLCVKDQARLIIIDDFDMSNPELKKGLKVYDYVLKEKLKHEITKRQLYIWNITTKK